jgi:NADH-quinone oxidoreductase subunit H
LFILAVSSMGIFGIVLGGWASNSHYSLLGALRASAQLVSYEVAAGIALVSGILLAGSLSTRKIIEMQADQGVWFVFLAPVAFFIYLVASIAETNRAPFDLPEAESELVAGYMTEYSGFRWAIYFLAEYANMIVVAGIATTLFLGGWMRPFPKTAAFNFLDYLPPLLFVIAGLYSLYRTPKQPVGVQKLVMAAIAGLCLVLALAVGFPLLPGEAGGRVLADFQPVVHGVFWFLAKVAAYLYFFMWIRFTFPRYRFDQLMRLGWHFLIPVSLVNLMGVGLALVLHRDNQWPLWSALGFSTAITLLVGAWLAWVGERREQRERATGFGAESF